MECFCSLLQVSSDQYFLNWKQIFPKDILSGQKCITHTHTHTHARTPPDAKVIEMENDTMR